MTQGLSGEKDHSKCISGMGQVFWAEAGGEGQSPGAGEHLNQVQRRGFRIDLLRKVEEGMGEMGRRCGQSSEAGLLGRQPIRSLGCV